MKLWLLAPVKPFGEGKSRLAESLNADQRATLSQQLLIRMLSLAGSSDLFAGLLVISRDRAVLDVAAEAGATVMEEPGEGLNSALETARGQAVAWGADAILVLPSDLPQVTLSDLEQLLDLPDRGDAVVLAPSQDGGTNAMLLRPPHAIDFAYGQDSFRRHRALAEEAGLPIKVVNSPTLAFDIDSPADLKMLSAQSSFTSKGSQP